MPDPLSPQALYLLISLFWVYLSHTSCAQVLLLALLKGLWCPEHPMLQ